MRLLDNYALRVACKCGRIGTAQYLVQKFGLTNEDVQEWKDKILKWACKNDKEEIVKWLLDDYGTVEEARELSKIENISSNMKELLKDYEPLGLYTKDAKVKVGRFSPYYI